MIDQGPEIMRQRREAEKRRIRIERTCHKVLNWLLAAAILLAIVGGLLLTYTIWTA